MLSGSGQCFYFLILIITAPGNLKPLESHVNFLNIPLSSGNCALGIGRRGLLHFSDDIVESSTGYLWVGLVVSLD